MAIPKDELTYFAVAQRMSATTELSAEFWFAVLNTKAMQSKSFGETPAGIAAMAAEVLTRAPNTPIAGIKSGLVKALNGNLIAQKFKKSVPVRLRGDRMKQ